MAKLQKKGATAHEQRPERHSTAANQPRTKAVRLTPAEIRAQNNGGAASPKAQVPGRDSAAKLPGSHVTPPPSPTKQQSAYQTQLSRTASLRPPTPPRSPGLKHSNTFSAPQNGVADQQPRPRQSVPLEAYRGLVGARGTSSRTSSVSSSIRGAPMKYRGHEITRTGSISMFQNPQPDIVNNPLSNFSRPRNKYSPPGTFNPDSNSDETSSNHRSSRTRSSTAVSAVSSHHSTSGMPLERAGSPVSFMSRASRQFAIVDEESLPKAEVQQEGLNGNSNTVSTEASPQKMSRTDWQTLRDKKKTTPPLFDQPKEAPVAVKKARRHTFSWKRLSNMEHKQDSPAKEAPVGEEKLEGEQLEEKTEEKVTEAELSPAPESTTSSEQATEVAPSSIDKGKGRARDSAPAVMGVRCCDKCGRIKRIDTGKHLSMPPDRKENRALVLAGPSSYNMVSPTDAPVANPAALANAAQLIMHRQRGPRQPQPIAVRDFASIAQVAKHNLVQIARPTTVQIAQPSTIQVARPNTPAAAQNPADDTLLPENAAPRITRFASLHGHGNAGITRATADTAPPESNSEKEVVPFGEEGAWPFLNTAVMAAEQEEVIQMRATSTPIDEPMPEFFVEMEDEYEPPKLELLQRSTSKTPPLRPRYSFESSRPPSIIDMEPATQQSASSAIYQNQTLRLTAQ